MTAAAVEREPMTMTWDPEPLTPAQRAGEACLSCHKKWPAPRILVGTLPDNRPVLACPECAQALT